jgi:EmrB/QacA subfamily drug resistance transporter
MDRKWWVLLSVGIGSFMAALDGSIVNTVLPVIEKRFDTHLAAVQWTVTIYLLAVSVLLLSFGRAGDLWGHRRVYLSGFWLFVIGSALCGMSPGIGTLIAFRGLQAIGAAMLFASAPAILTLQFPSNQRGQALGLQATMTYLGLAFGPALGGWLADAFSWRAVFYINVPVGAVALLAAARCIPVVPRHEDHERFDRLGATLFMAGLAALLLTLNQGHSWGWASWPVATLVAASVALLAVFLRFEMRAKYPMLDLSLFRRPVFSASVAAAVLNYICMASINFVMPFYLHQGHGLSMAHTGLLLSLQPLVMAIAAPISGTISDRIHSTLPSAVGMLILGCGTFLLHGIGPHTSLAYLAIGFCVTGLGTGIFISPNNSALMGSAPTNRQGIAAGMLATARNVGIVLGVGISGAVLTTGVAHGHTLTESIAVGLRISTIAAVLSGLVSLAPRLRKDAETQNGTRHGT